MDLGHKINGFLNTKDCTEEFEAEDIAKNRGLAALAYIPILLMVPLFAVKESSFVRFHVNQGILVAIIEMAVFFVLGPLSRIPYIGVVFDILKSVVLVICVVLLMIGMANSLGGKAKELPLIGGIRLFSVKTGGSNVEKQITEPVVYPEENQKK